MEPSGELAEAYAALAHAGDELTALALVAGVRDALARWEAELARDALAAGASWQTIGQTVGTSRQAAWERLRPAIAAAIEADRRQLQEQRTRVAKRRGRTHEQRG